VLSRAQELTAQLSAGPLVERMLQAFGRLPTPDREPIVRVLERDATCCRIVGQTSDTTGVTVRPNPHASLYVQVVGHVPDEPLRRDVDVIRYPSSSSRSSRSLPGGRTRAVDDLRARPDPRRRPRTARVRGAAGAGGGGVC
jgi:hypothetical protein